MHPSVPFAENVFVLPAEELRQQIRNEFKASKVPASNDLYELKFSLSTGFPFTLFVFSRLLNS